MLQLHEYGMYTIMADQELRIYMVQHDGGVDGVLGLKEPPAVTYCLDVAGHTALLFWPDWLAFAHKVNSIAGEEILNPMQDPAVEMGIVLPIELACPKCGCRVVDTLEPLDVYEDSTLNFQVFCHHCEEPFNPGEN